MNPALSDNTRCSGSDDRPGVGTPVLSTRSITTAREASTRADLEALFGHSLVALAVDLDLGRTLDLPPADRHPTPFDREPGRSLQASLAGRGGHPPARDI